MKILATICARGGSKGVPNKNLKLLQGKPLIAHTIEQAINYRGFDKIIVSTDSEEIAKVAEHYGAEVPFLRPQELALDTTPKIPVIQHAVRYVEEKFDVNYDIIVDLDPTSPLRNLEDIERCVNEFLKKRPNNVISVTAAHKNPYFNMVEETDGKVHLCKKIPSGVFRRQDAPKVFSLNASIYVYDKTFLFNTESVFSDNTIAVEMPEERSLDIDRPIDFEIVEYLFQKRQNNNQ